MNFKEIKDISANELEEILKSNVLSFALELGVLQEFKLSKKPIYKFERAFRFDNCNENFYMIYREADDCESIYISVNFSSPKYYDFLNELLIKYKFCKIIIHNFNNFDGEYFESYYFDENKFNKVDFNFSENIRELNLNDENLCKNYANLNNQETDEENYFNTIFDNFFKRKIWYDCGIIGYFDDLNNKNNKLVGWLAYYSLTENIRDVSYIYTNPEFRNKGIAKNLLKYFVNKNLRESKISFYSYADGEISVKLAKSCGFLSCAKRIEKEF